jgi:hypothetical protein
MGVVTVIAVQYPMALLKGVIGTLSLVHVTGYTEFVYTNIIRPVVTEGAGVIIIFGIGRMDIVAGWSWRAKNQ